jgi:hypothetical protein
MAIVEKTKQCAGTVGCRFRMVMRVAVVLTLLGIAGAVMLH